MTNKNFYEKANELIKLKSDLKNTVYEKADLRSVKTAGDKKLKQLDTEGTVRNLRVKSSDKILAKTTKSKAISSQECYASAMQNSLNNFEVIQKQLTFLKKVKGGGTVFNSGLLGFLPNNQVKCFATKIQKSIFLNRKKKTRLSNLIFLSMKSEEQKRKKKFHVFKAPFKGETAKIYPYTPKNRVKNKLNSYKNQMNFVFTVKNKTKKHTTKGTYALTWRVKHQTIKF